MNIAQNQLLPITTRAGYAGKHIYEILTDRLLALQSMLGSYGFTSPIHRIRIHLEILKRLREGYGIQSDEVLWSLVEATELTDIWCAMPRMSARTMSEKFNAILNGPTHPQQETAASGLARNTVFELSLASWLCHKGIPAYMGHNPDISCEVSDRRVFIQCKRPFSRQKVTDNVKRACKQLSRDLDFAGDPRNRGVVAISLNHAVNPGVAFMEVRNEADLVPAMASQIGPVAEHTVAAMVRGPRIVGAVFSFIAAAYIQALNEYRTGRLLTLHISENASGADKTLLRRVFLPTGNDARRSAAGTALNSNSSSTRVDFAGQTSPDRLPYGG